MESWDRVVSALLLETPDRVPVFEMHMSSPIAEKVLGRSCLCYNLRKILHYLSSGKDVDKLNEIIADELIRIHLKAGLDYIRVPGACTETNVKVIGKDLYLIGGYKYRLSNETLWLLDEPKTYNEKDFEFGKTEVNYDVFKILELVSKRIKGKIFLSFDADGSWGPIVSRPNLMLHVLRWMRTKPSLVRKIIDHYTDIAISYGKAALDFGADAIMMCVDYGYSRGPWMSPKDFRTFIKTALRRQVLAFKGKGGFAILHSDGNINAILDDIVDAGIDAYQGIDIIAGMDLKSVKERFGDRICLIGNFNPKIIDYGSKKEVYDEVLRCLRDGAPGGGYIFSTSANLSSSFNGENFIFMLKVLKEKYYYPIC